MQGVDPEDEPLLLSLLELALLDLLLAPLARAARRTAPSPFGISRYPSAVFEARVVVPGKGNDATGVDACDDRTG